MFWPQIRALAALPPVAVAQVTNAEAIDAIRRLDAPRMAQYLRRGWNPSTELDDQRNEALHKAVEICEWDPAHDQQKLVVFVRTLVDGGARMTANVWGDTPYDLAKAERFCGPNHPATQILALMFAPSGR